MDAFPPHQTEYVLQPPIQSYQSVLNTPEQQTSQYSSVVTKYARLLPDTPMIVWKSKQGIIYRIAPPYTLVVPQSYPEAMNLNMPEYSWAQGLIVASHSLRLCLLWHSLLRLHVVGGRGRAAGCDPAYT